MQQIYCISGLGADEKAFKNLQIHGYELKYIPWLRPGKNEAIEEYAKRMSGPIGHESPVLLGLSFGGMIGIEIAKQMPVRKLIIVSGVKSTNELPGWMKVAGALHLNKLLPTRPTKLREKIDNGRLGATTREEMDLIKNYRRTADPVYMQWAISKVFNWKNNWHPENLIHIHGDKDRVFPVRKVKAHHIIKEGTHIMIYNRAAEISEVIRRELATL
jgi:pimeloyl-ACP methyl ester carboxylesterase